MNKTIEYQSNQDEILQAFVQSNLNAQGEFECPATAELRFVVEDEQGKTSYTASISKPSFYVAEAVISVDSNVNVPRVSDEVWAVELLRLREQFQLLVINIVGFRSMLIGLVPMDYSDSAKVAVRASVRYGYLILKKHFESEAQNKENVDKFFSQVGKFCTLAQAIEFAKQQDVVIGLTDAAGLNIGWVHENGHHYLG